MNQEIFASIAAAVIGLAIVAVIFSRNSQTSQVLGAAGNAFGGILKVAVSPITGGGGMSVANTASPGGFGAFTPQALSGLGNPSGGILGTNPLIIRN